MHANIGNHKTIEFNSEQKINYNRTFYFDFYRNSIQEIYYFWLVPEMEIENYSR